MTATTTTTARRIARALNAHQTGTTLYFDHEGRVVSEHETDNYRAARQRQGREDIAYWATNSIGPHRRHWTYRSAQTLINETDR